MVVCYNRGCFFDSGCGPSFTSTDTHHIRKKKEKRKERKKERKPHCNIAYSHLGISSVVWQRNWLEARWVGLISANISAGLPPCLPRNLQFFFFSLFLSFFLLSFRFSERNGSDNICRISNMQERRRMKSEVNIYIQLERPWHSLSDKVPIGVFNHRVQNQLHPPFLTIPFDNQTPIY